MNQRNRIISLLLSVVMIISLFPTVAFVATAEEVSYTYSFSAADYTESPEKIIEYTDKSGNPASITGIINYIGLARYTDYSSDNYSAGQRNWKYLGMSANAYTAWSNAASNDGRNTAGFPAGGMRFAPPASGEWVAVKLRVPEAGIYTLSYQTIFEKANVVTGLASNATVSVFPANTTEAEIRGKTNQTLTSENMLAYNCIDFNNPTVGASETRSIGTSVIIANKAGEELVVALTGHSKDNIRIRSLKLTKVSDELVLSADEVLLGEGETATVTASLKQNTVIKALGASYEIADTGIAKVNAAGKITPVSAGWTTLTVTLGDLSKTIAVGVRDASGSVPGEKPNLEPELSFPQEFLHVGETVKITNANSSYTFASSDNEVATISEDGAITAVKLGRVTVTATKGDIEKSFEIPVVGENLINRNGIDHGHFENGIYFSDNSDAQKADSFWNATRRIEEIKEENSSYKYYIYDYAYENVLLPGRAEKVKAVKFIFDGSVINGDPDAARNTILLTPPESLQTSADANQGLVVAEKDKLYEFTGWTAAENTTKLGDMWNMISYMDCVGSVCTEIYGQSIKPWDNKSGNQLWQMFTTFPVIVDRSSDNQVIAMRPRMQSVDPKKVGNILVTEFSLHEVVYDHMELTADKTEIAASEIASLSAKHFSNTGNAIKQISNKKPVDASVPITYKSKNTDVVRVMDDGKIIGVSDGVAIVTATATICGVTQTEEIEITVSGGTRPEFVGSVELAIIGENITPATYATTALTVKNENSETMTLNANEVTYESSDNEVATVTSNGVIRAKTAGEAIITVKVKRFGLEKTASVTLVVAPLPAETDFPEVIGAYFTTDHTYVGGENTIVVTDLYGRKLGSGITYEYEIGDDSIISENNGMFVGKMIGRTAVKVFATLDGVTREAEVPAVVVGNNLLIRKGVNHGELENGIYLNDGSADTVKNSSFWTGAHTAARGLFTYELLRNQFSGIAGAPATPTNIATFTMPDGETTDNLKLVRIQGSADVYDASGTKHTGLVKADANKLYEFSGYIKAEDVNPLPENTCGSLLYISGSGSSSTDLKSYKATPWIGKTGDQDWTKFNIAPVVMNWPSVKEYNLRPGFEALTDDQNHGYKLSVAHLSLHEVVFDSIAFSASGDFSKAKTYDTFATTATLLSNTGAEITVGNTNEPIVISYKSDDESVARISEDGVITAVSDGTTKVRAYATVLGITKEATIEVTFSGLEVMFDRVDVSVDTELDVGEAVQIEAVLRNTDNSQFVGDAEIYYESTDTSVAVVSQDGVISAKKSGNTDINVYGILGKRRVKTTVSITVNDTTLLKTVTISGSDIVEQGFAVKLSVSAFHESTSEADMSAATVKFQLAPGADENVISITEDGIVTGKAIGEASVIATVTAKNGSSKTSDPFFITVVEQSPKSKVFDFTKYPLNTSVLNQTLENDGFEINRDMSSPGILSGNLNSCRYLAFGISSVVSATGNTKNADTVLDVKIDYDGWYEIDFKGALNHSGAGLAYIYIDGTYLGEYRFYDPVDQADVPAINLNTIYLTAGVHQFTIRSIQSGETGTMAAHTRSHTVSGITFRYLNETPELCDPVITAERYELAVGESVDLNIEVPLSNGRVHSFGKRHGEVADTQSNLNVASSDSSVVEYNNGVITAKAEGEAAITASALVYNNSSQSTVEVTVTDEKLTRVENLNAGGITLYVGDSADIALRAFVKGKNNKEREIAVSNLTFTYELVGGDGIDVVTVADGKLTAVAIGNATLAVTARLGTAESITSYIPVAVLADGFASATLGAVTQVVKYGGEGTDLFVKVYDNFAKEIDSSKAEISYTVSTGSEFISVDENGRVLPIAEGVAEVYAVVTIDGITHTTNVLPISVRTGKVGSTYYTPERVAAARENIKKYDWAKDEAKAAIEKADKYLQYVDYIYNMITNHTIPRSVYLEEVNALVNGLCMYCGTDVYHKYGAKKSWTVDGIREPWKVQCAECKRLFPSNDFESFYQLGLDEHGEFNRQLALENNGILCGRGERNADGEYVVFEEYADNPYGYGDENGNLWNESFNELRTSGIDPWKKVPITQGWISEEAAAKEGIGNFWGVDDGLGYDTGRTHSNGVKEIHRYIALFNYTGIWYCHGAYDQPLVYASLTAFRDAYLYTGDKKYGIAGAIILDRVADLYPDFNYGVDCVNLVTSGNGRGKISGYIHENFVNRPFTTGYDAFFDCYDEPEVIKFLSRYAEKWNLDNKKTNGELIRQNAEENILMETYYATGRGWIRGNFGMKQETVTKAATVLDREPETSEMIDFVMRNGILVEGLCTGCDLYEGIMNSICRDGYGNEGSLSYNGIFSGSFVEVINTLMYYGKVKGKYDLINNPKVIASLTLGTDTILAGKRHANIGDMGSGFGAPGLNTYQANWLLGMQKTDNPLFAQILYFTNRNSAKGIRYDIFTKDPESPETEIEKIIQEYGELNLSKSAILTGYGFAALRGGVLYNDVTSTTKQDTMRDWWMFFGVGNSTTHKHMDALNLGIDAFGLNMAPDHGYGGSGGTANQGNNTEYWFEGTPSHNTVMVNDTQQTRYGYSFPLHFDDAGSVKVMDVDAAQVYPDITDIYRRTVVSVDIDDSISYALDFFRIKGGDEHLYSFHSQSEESIVTGVEFDRQPQGSYAGIDVEPANISYTGTDGFNMLKNVERAVYPENKEFSIDFKITDYQRVLSGNRNLHLKLTQLNSFNASEVVRADGYCIEDARNPETTDYLLVRRSGKNLDTLFTSVIEPYEDSSKIKSLERVEVVRKDGGEIRESDAVAAVRVELHNGRVDYVVYSARNDVEYRVADLFDFIGFVGVYSVNVADESDVLRTYIQDGTKLGDMTSEYAAVTGEVVDFTDALNYENGDPILNNYIEVTAPTDVDAESLIGRLVVVDNDGAQNGAYVIETAERKGENILLGTGDVNFFRSLAEDDETFIWNIERGQTYSIPMSAYSDVAPELSVSGTYVTAAGSSVEIPINVTSEREYTLVGTVLPRGMSIDKEREVLIWKPTSSQTGENHVAITADNGYLSNTIHFVVTVYGSTTGTGSGGGAGGGGGGAAPAPSKPAEDDKKDEEEKKEDTPATPSTPSVDEDVRFVDLGAHAWATEAINALADEEIIKGTSENTFSPAANITRADFALLLVRAFKLDSDNAENFADVAESDYFAKELAIARNTGVVNGIGDNKYAPRNTITRQDMMTIVYRAMQKLDVGFGVYDDPQYVDFANVAEYAKDAVKALIGAGLVNGKSGKIAPADYTTRAEVAVLIKRILDFASDGN